MKRLSWLFVLSLSLLLILSTVGCNSQNSEQSPEQNTPVAQTEIMVSAAASLQNAMTELQQDYAQKKPDVKLTLNFGSSGKLQQQIEQGAPADLFLSAGQSQMDALEEKNLLVKDSRINLLSNDLVIVAGKDSTKVNSLEDLSEDDVEKIGLGTPESVPAGKYAKEALTSLNLWDSLNSKFVMAKDVTQVLNYVETGNVEAGFVYSSDAQGSDKVKVVMALPESSHKPIVYPAAIISSTKNLQASQDFLNYLQGSNAKQVFAKYGFKTPAK
ncbi:molybdenum ABC transporter, periplasmic molybdate-binding protein [Desulfosporosinus orientis DSM 765]|uniref:Molybdenum ABC transporter, periplasmic molybdate-binding protein n=1 Tax=Desulfosporosinus orientis (strain ATCC 19365 / DSM 765 / NCIMB 8382 / VKM B-1628 / Singapore I) TaxID=768706 RepID=G7W7N6_DESOD|nr:molybdate ABC transporter substrate-binding protein [Desulfosporosinus orientis]AET66101.1 molybdenum ABC transporter, periplasmic molybdate-binding protein [Desulfosporosinus orientis DSM 765]